MFRIFFLLLFIGSTVKVSSQNVFWATKVEGFSTEYVFAGQAKENRAIQVLGRPSKLPQSGTTVCAWQPSQAENPNEEWIKVSFDTLINIRQVAVAENFGQGCISQIFAYDQTDKEYLIYENLKINLERGSMGKMLNVILEERTSYKVKSIKVALITARVKGWNQIDAIGISESETPIEALINVSSAIPADLAKENMGVSINSKTAEMAPIISSDGKTLYFTRGDHPNNLGVKKEQDVWFSVYQGGQWQPAQNIGNPINTDDNNAICGVSIDGKNAILINVYRPDGTLTNGLSYSKKIKGNWSFPKEMKIRNFRNDNSTGEFCLSPNGRVMIMTIQRKDSYGSKDIYCSFLNADSTWSEPFHTGNVINTAETETTPFIAADNKTLYFSTWGFSGYGSSDIFLTRRLDDTWKNWSEPENLGAVINTTEWDGYFTIPASGDYAYLCSQEESLGKEDIFRLKLYPAIKPEPVAIISGQVLNYSDKKPIASAVIADILSENKEAIKVDFDPSNAEFKLVLPLKKSYGLSAYKKGFLPISENIDLTREKSFREIKKNLYLIPLEPGQRMVLANVFFPQSEYELLATSYAELDKIAEAMNEFCNLEIMLEGHTDNQGDIMANLKLSENRVNEVKNYIVSKGVDAYRIQTKGWGASRPMASNAVEEKRKINRRVEFIVLKN